MNADSLSSRRAAVGVAAILCLACAAGLWLFTAEPAQNQFLSAVTRVGIVLAALWLALPARGESIAWEKALPLVIGAVVLVAVTRRAFPYVLPAVLVIGIALAFLRPRGRKRRR